VNSQFIDVVDAASLLATFRNGKTYGFMTRTYKKSSGQNYCRKFMRGNTQRKRQRDRESKWLQRRMYRQNINYNNSNNKHETATATAATAARY
jgi:hypothetical protein